MIDKSITILKRLQHPSGLFVAALDERTHYSKQSWIRDCIYASLGFEATKKTKELVKAYQALLDVFKKHEYKIDWAIVEKPQHRWQYIHARFDPNTYDEFHENWGNKQNDSIGAFLFKVGDLEAKGIKVIRDKDDERILQKLVYYLNSLQYWHDADSGMWEENEEVHASSVGACVAGLKKISKIVDVPPVLIQKGEETLNQLLPRESCSKDVDLALLSLIYPYDVVSAEQRDQILLNVEAKLVRQRGVIRYVDDYYFNRDGEAEWTFGFPWLSIIYQRLNRPDKAAHYMRKTLEVVNKDGELPELYYANSDEHNENTPLGWGQSLLVVAMKETGTKI
ncbi:glycoside hydrolase family 15 [Candidatus Woesearchaeota archaeon]|nr:glycoside hydrolase family 15 [Candidatus Woesearchaeota archaeon]